MLDIRLKIMDVKSHVIKKCAKFWLEKFFDPSKGFFERLGYDFTPLDMGYTRLLTQCRMIYVNSQIYTLTGNVDFLAAAQKGYELVVGSYRSGSNGFYFSLKSDGSVCDNNYDLYGHAFVLFALSHYYRASRDPKVLSIAKITLNFINSNFKVGIKMGYYEALDYNLQPIKKIRRQNPHMHLLESCLSMYETTQDLAYLDTSDSIIYLFHKYFFDENTSTLGEFFDDDLNPHQEYGHIVEPGHHFEWVSLLHKRSCLYPLPINLESIEFTINNLFNWGRSNGVDSENGGIFNEVNRDGIILNSNKRIWALTEAIKAYSIMWSYKNETELQLCNDLNNLLSILISTYIRPNGSWIEICNRDLTPQTDYLPGSTPYHILSGIMESYVLINNTFTVT